MEHFYSIPHFQPIPFPAPLWFLKFFLVFGFYLHAIPMNVTLTGGVTAALLTMYGRLKNHAYALRLGHQLAFSLPFFVSVAITQGIVPLLFIQLVYGPLFYTSSILIAAPWLLVIFMLLGAYYAYYVYTYQREALGRRAVWVLLAAGVFFLGIAFVFSNNTTLMLTPERWGAMYHNSPSGVNLNLGEPQLIPRYLHFVVAAFAVTGLAIGCFGLYWHSREREYGQWLIRTGSAIFLLPTLLQIPIGIWFLLSLPARIMWNFIGQDSLATGLFAGAMLLDLVGITSMAMAWKDGSPRPFRVGLVSALTVVLLMIIMRHLLRVFYVKPFFSPEGFPVETQWVLLVIFLSFFVIGLVYIGWLVKITWDAFNPPQTPSQAK